mmetsp:Transcript_7402/g.15249  ORF Transcript_7402/g.15249 Transcript_7402/m.15249 type:complete len:208 (-) Transcript_7402:1123-1746(-)
MVADEAPPEIHWMDPFDPALDHRCDRDHLPFAVASLEPGRLIPLTAITWMAHCHLHHRYPNRFVVVIAVHPEPDRPTPLTIPLTMTMPPGPFVLDPPFRKIDRIEAVLLPPEWLNGEERMLDRVLDQEARWDPVVVQVRVLRERDPRAEDRDRDDPVLLPPSKASPLFREVPVRGGGVPRSVFPVEDAGQDRDRTAISKPAIATPSS